jgi:hypothetical protein
VLQWKSARADALNQGCGVSGVRQKGSGIEGWCMAKATKTKPRDRLVRWRVSLIKGTPPKFIDFAYAPDAQAAERRVAKEHKISSTLRSRLVAIRDDL